VSARAATCVLLLALAGSALGQGRGAQAPTLLVTNAELPALRKRLSREPFKSRWALFLSKASRGQPKPQAKLDDLASVRWLAWTVVNRSFAYRVTGDEAQREAAWEALRPALKWERWHRDWDWNKGAELPTAVLALASGVFYDACGAGLDAEERAWFLERVERLALRPYLASIEEHKDWWVADPLSNWTGTVHGQCGVLALALRDALPAARRAAEHAHAHLERFLRTVILEDGGGHEGVMYTRGALEPAFVFLHAWSRTLGKRDDWAGLDAVVRERLAGYWEVYLYGPDRVYANFNDMEAKTFSGLFADDPAKRTFGGPNANLAALFESFYPKGDPLLLWAADHGGGGDFSRGIAPWWFLWRRAAPPSRGCPPLQPAVLFRGAGHAVLRTPRLWLALQGGWIPDSAIHKNFDLGSFVFVADGTRWVHDPGYGKQSAGDHSALSFPGEDGKALEQRKAARGVYRALWAGKTVRYAAVDLSAAYPPERLTRWVRHALLLGERTAVLLDEIELAQPGDAALRLQLPGRPELAGQLAQLSLDGASSSLAIQVLGGTPRVAKGYPIALLTALDPTQREHLVFTVLTAAQDGERVTPPKLTPKGKRLTLRCTAGELLLERTRQGWVPTRFGKTKLKAGDPAKRSLEPVTGRR